MEDKRIEKTLQLIENSFFELYREKSIEKISITEICKLANINRSTFYYHYEDYPSLLNSIENSIINDYLDLNETYQYDTNTKQLLSDTIQYILNNQEKMFFLFRNGTNGKGVQIIKESLKEKSRPVWMKESNLSPEEFELVFTYFIEGTFSLLEYFLKNPHLQKEKFMNILEQVGKYGVYNFVYTK